MQNAWRFSRRPSVTLAFMSHITVNGEGGAGREREGERERERERWCLAVTFSGARGLYGKFSRDSGTFYSALNERRVERRVRTETQRKDQYIVTLEVNTTTRHNDTTTQQLNDSAGFV
ncbi:hypothetical protein EYF80_029708 [Liparis tanakae]|uniref:Uncharacterized protein n=1 Tax=Liparis tanakae TaxID=230148 RepID=A0A4Z2H2N9_9TELE|nr:hypothetical protein EYF80_029708 [Liparis tanakae]